MENDLSTSESIADAMSALGMNQVRFAEVVGVHQTTVSRWVTGEAIPSGPTKKLIARLLDEQSKRPRKSSKAKQPEAASASQPKETA